VWLPTFVCPECGGGLTGVWCRACARTYAEREGIWRFLTAAREAAIEPFVRQYRAVRQREGRHRFRPDEYRALPVVDRRHPQAAEWRIRRESYAHLLRRCFAHAPQPARVLDLGAGCGWLSHRLAELGHRVVAVDILDDEHDGLGAVKHYDVRFAAVQADFDRLPFAPEQFDVIVFNGSLHYAADAAATLGHARRVLAPGGALVVMDSPIFASPKDGEAMVLQQAHAIHGVGFLTGGSLTASADALGLAATFVESRGPLVWRTRRRVSRLRLRRAPATFGVWVAQ
jgi:SAM-dependent methyltransferase